MGKNYMMLFLLSLLPATLAGCGSDSAPPISALAASQSCIGCHASAVSSVTGLPRVDEWKLSTHNTKNGAGCADCHEPAAGHPESCRKCHGGAPVSGTGHDVTVNPDQAQKCYKCHGLQHPTDIMLVNAPQHFGNLTTSIANSKYRASYVSSTYQGNCRKCHNPHDPSTAMPISRQWAASGHGDTRAGTRTAYDFKTRGTYQPAATTFEAYCVRCHTTTGYIDFVTSGFTDQRPFAGPGYPAVQYPVNSTDKTKEVTGCNACHDDGRGNAYGYKLRPVPQVTVYYNFSSSKAPVNVRINGNDSKVVYPDARSSNICVVCHAGRGIGRIIKIAAAKFLNFSSTNRVSPHDFGGAATLFKQNGYEYDGRDYANPANFLHESIGMGNLNGTGTKGPCIACHLNSAESHSFLPVKIDPATGRITDIISRTCGNCHNNTAVSGTLLSAWTPADLQAKRVGLHASLTALNALLAKKKVTSSTANWERLYGKGTGANTMGAFFNYEMTKNDWGSYVHNATYAKRLIYDSFDWLFDGNLDAITNSGGYGTDVEAAIRSLTLAAGLKDVVTGIVYTEAELNNLKDTAVSYLLSPGGGRP